ncbi:MAG: Mur ligase family protein, partial [Actinomycetota bacterium]
NVVKALSSLVGSVGDDEVLVVELSSFQLEDSIDFRPDVAVLLNLAEDHLNRHDTLDDYFAAKMRIFANQGVGDTAVLNFDDENIRGCELPGGVDSVWFSRTTGGRLGGGAGKRPKDAGDRGAAGDALDTGEVVPAVFMRSGAICADIGAVLAAGKGVRSRLTGAAATQETDAATQETGTAAQETGTAAQAQGRNGFSDGEDAQEIIVWSEAALRGDHNLENALAATAACLCLGVEEADLAAGLRTFPGVRHRLQKVAVVG